MFRGTGLIPWFIRLWTRSSWAHCGVLVMVEDVTMVVEARYPEGVALHAFINRIGDGPDIYSTGREINVREVISHAGDGYSVIDAILAGIDGKQGHHAGWECAEFCAHIYGLDHDPRGWTPQSLVAALSTGVV